MCMRDAEQICRVATIEFSRGFQPTVRFAMDRVAERRLNKSQTVDSIVADATTSSCSRFRGLKPTAKFIPPLTRPIRIILRLIFEAGWARIFQQFTILLLFPCFNAFPVLHL